MPVHCFTLLYCTRLYRCVQERKVVYTPLRSCTVLYTPVHACTSLYKPVHACTRLYTPVHTCTLLYSPILYSLNTKIIEICVHRVFNYSYFCFLRLLGTAAFIASNKGILKMESTSEGGNGNGCNKDTGGNQKCLQKWSRGLLHFVRGGGHIDSWSPLYLCVYPPYNYFSCQLLL